MFAQMRKDDMLTNGRELDPPRSSNCHRTGTRRYNGLCEALREAAPQVKGAPERHEQATEKVGTPECRRAESRLRIPKINGLSARLDKMS